MGSGEWRKSLVEADGGTTCLLLTTIEPGTKLPSLCIVYLSHIVLSLSNIHFLYCPRVREYPVTPVNGETESSFSPLLGPLLHTPLRPSCVAP